MSGVESLRVGNAQRQHLTGFRHHDEERIRVDVSGQNNVFAQTERVLSIDLRQIEHVSALILGSALERGTGRLVHSPSLDRKSTRLNSSHVAISYAVFCLK